MRVVMIYREASEHRREVEAFLNDFTRQTGRKIETMDPDSKEAQEFAKVYDIVEYPTMVALSDDGQLQNNWRGLPLPTISEVSYYV
jgi:hypothetical protein